MTPEEKELAVWLSALNRERRDTLDLPPMTRIAAGLLAKDDGAVAGIAYVKAELQFIRSLRGPTIAKV